MDIFLVRHGEASASWGQESDPGLSDLGRQQADAVADSLAGHLPEGIRLISSPLARAQETAQPLAERLGLTPEINGVFREIPSPVSLGERQGWLRAFMTQDWSEQGKELHAWRSDMLRVLQELEGPVVIFTHFLVINTVVGHVLDRTETLSFLPDNGSITQLHHTGEDLQLVVLGEQLETVVN